MMLQKDNISVNMFKSNKNNVFLFLMDQKTVCYVESVTRTDEPTENSD